ncbi:MAG TPA: hypothetical protein VLD67_22380 [Vicinamibacterales bacterium]|nr:hypothetical protein [Vicinamibacterales bacterium]
MFSRRGDMHVGDVDLAVVVDDANGEPLAERIETVPFEFTAADLGRTRGTKREWLEASLTLDVTGEPSYVRVVVFEYETGWFTADSISLRR